ncbi:uncharacterized protein LOC134540023 isoform X5 [Bacillus rossius redtenbacheri]|uniref:uncharacterized protein LOC134540023 isoform X5 n=1 Tax=Bacillus rossius redtenbacheri TaxID=93214 RepID=UPI002FDE016F
MERGLGTVPLKLGLRLRMESLVPDLSSALEESSRTPASRRRWGLRRRARSTGNLVLACHRTQSDDSSSSFGERLTSKDRGASSLHQSDSDDLGASGGVCRRLAQFSLTSRRVALLHGTMESDSFNENFSPVHPSTRRYRKRRFKRMAVDSGEGSKPCTSQAPPPPPLAPLGATKKKRIMKHATASPCDARLGSLLCGKRKRSVRETKMHCDGAAAATRPKTSRVFTAHKLGAGDTHMETTGHWGRRAERLVRGRGGRPRLLGGGVPARHAHGRPGGHGARAAGAAGRRPGAHVGGRPAGVPHSPERAGDPSGPAQDPRRAAGLQHPHLGQ